jgi:hypothetical protein
MALKSPEPIHARFMVRSRLAVWSIRLVLSVVVAIAIWWVVALFLGALVSALGFQSPPGSFLAAALVWLSPLGAGWFVVLVLFLASLQLSRYVVGTEKAT